MRTNSRSGGRCTVTWLPNFLGSAKGACGAQLLKEKLSIIFRGKIIYAYHHTNCSPQKLKPWGLGPEKEFFVAAYLFFRPQRVLTLKEILTYFVFYEYLVAARGKKKNNNNKRCLLLYFSRLNNALFGRSTYWLLYELISTIAFCRFLVLLLTNFRSIFRYK